MRWRYSCSSGAPHPHRRAPYLLRALTWSPPGGLVRCSSNCYLFNESESPRVDRCDDERCETRRVEPAGCETCSSRVAPCPSAIGAHAAECGAAISGAAFRQCRPRASRALTMYRYQSELDPKDATQRVRQATNDLRARLDRVAGATSFGFTSLSC